ncbi:MAG: asparagine synthase (glutamine-hydrolyzing) [Rhodospirillaceae bacterium]
MCGIAGIVARRAVNRAAVEAMMDGMAHRGPDGAGLWMDDAGRVAIGHRRLAIIDPTPAGDQPMLDPAGERVLSYNGEIYNYVEVRERLKAEGRSFVSGSDSEVLMQACAAWGEAGLSEINGMFAFALLDRRAGKLFCARDRFGEKPFLYVATPEFFAFASEYRALLSLAEVAADIDTGRLLAFLHQPRRGLDDGADTVFPAIRQLRAGERLSVDTQTLAVTVEPYWKPRIAATPAGLTEADAVDRFRELLTDSVAIRIRSDVPVGSCLSGGLDSGSIVCLNRRHLGDGPAYHVFTGRFPGSAADEGPFAQAVVDATGVTSHVTEPSPERFLDELPNFVWMNELPVGSASQYAQWCVFRLAAETGVTVLLDGQGADEVLAGYEQYFAPYLRARAARGAMEAGEDAAIRARYPSALPTAGQAWTAGLPSGLRHRLANWTGRGSDFRFGLAPDVAAGIADAKAEDRDGSDALAAALLDDAFHAHLPTLLRYGDRNSMAHSREVRLPFCDHRIAELALSLPPEMLMGGAETKRLVRQAMRGVLPDAVRKRWNKQGFLPPQDDWLAGPLRAWAAETFTSAAFAGRGFWNVRWWRRALERFDAGERHLAWSIWKPLIGEAWLTHFRDRVKSEPRQSVFAPGGGGA